MQTWVMSHQSVFVLHCRLAKNESLSGVPGHISAEVMIVLSEVIMQMLTSRSSQRLYGHLVQCKKLHVGRNEKQENKNMLQFLLIFAHGRIQCSWVSN